MEYLVDDISPLIADFLSPYDAINFSSACSKLNSQLSLTTTHPREILTTFSKHERDDDRHYGFQIPVLSQAPVHSIRLSMKFSDQGWGNNKGRVFIVAQQEHQFHTLDRRTDFSSGIVPRDRDMWRTTITFKPRPNESYHLWYIVGGGGGHSLHLKNVSIQTLAFGDPTHKLEKAHEFLVKNKVSHPWDTRSRHKQNYSLVTILESTSFLLTNELPILPPMVSFFKDCGVPEENLSLSLISLIKSLQDDWEKELYVYNKSSYTHFEERDNQWARTVIRVAPQHLDYNFDDDDISNDYTTNRVEEETNMNRFSFFSRGRRRGGRQQLSWRNFLHRRGRP